MDLKKLREPFPADDVEWRVQSCGEKNARVWVKVIAYITARAIQERLDDVVGPENWQNEFTPWQVGNETGVLCGISIKVGNQWVTKHDGAENSDVEPIKGGLSNALKRAAVQWGIGRYLYQLREAFGTVLDNGDYLGKTKEGKYFNWNPPKLPAWALPEGEKPTNGKPPEKAPPNGNGSNGHKVEQKPTVATEEQQKKIQEMATELGLDVDRDILKKLNLVWPPPKKDAEGIIRRLLLKKQEAVKK